MKVYQNPPANTWRKFPKYAMLQHIYNPSQPYYSSSYRTKEAARINAWGTRVMQSRLRWIPFRADWRVLDAGCGISTLGKTFGNHVYGFDINHESGKHARRNGIIFTRGDIEKKWPYRDNTFDIVIASHVIEHVLNPDFLILEAKRVLKRGGLLIIGTPNLAAWFNRLLLLFGIQPFFAEVSTVDKTLGLKFTRKLTPSRNPLGHLRLFTSVALRDILELHKFDIVKSIGMEFIPFPAPLLFIDKIFSRYVSLASTTIIVGKKT